MAWIVLDLDGTLLNDDGEGTVVPTDGAIDYVNQFLSEGHKVTIQTARFHPMPAEARQKLKEDIERELASQGFPPLEIWMGTTKPNADIFIDDKAVTFDGDWELAKAQVDQMLEDRGLLEPSPPADDGSGTYPGAPTDEEMPEQ